MKKVTDDKLFVREILIGIVLSSMVFFVDAQDATKFSADLSIGPSIPIGTFADKNYTAVPNSNGLAKTGFAIYANLRYEISNKIGIVMTAQSSFNRQDPESFSDNINHGANFPQKTYMVTDDWKIFKILMGLYYQGHFSNKKLSYLISILGGVCKTSVPFYYYAVYTPSGSLYNESQQNSASLPWSFAYQAGAV